MSYYFNSVEHYSCCGVQHFCEFSDDLDDGEYESIADALADMGDNRLAEITLTDGQMKSMPGLVRDMAAARFILVNRFRNSNSGNIVNVFHRVPVREPLNEAPGWTRRVRIEGGVAGEPAAEPAVVSSTFHNVYPRSGRSDCGWPSREAATEHRGRAVSIDRRDVYSDGSVVWAEDI